MKRRIEHRSWFSRPRHFAAMGATGVVLFAVLVSASPLYGQDVRRGEREGGRHRPEMARPAPPQGGAPAFRGHWLERLKADNPEEFERLQNLRQEDPEAFRELMRERFRERMRERVGGAVRERRALDAQSRELADRYRAAATDEEKAAIREQLETSVYEAFDTLLEDQKRLAEQLENQLARLKAQIEEREETREEVCQKRIDALLEDTREP